MNDFSIHNFLLETVKGLVGHRPDYTVRDMAAGWYSKGVFSVDDVAEVEALIQAQYPVEETVNEPIEGEPIEQE